MMRIDFYKSRLKMDWRRVVYKTLLLLMLGDLAQAVSREPAMSEEEREKQGLVEIHYAPDLFVPYRERRSSWAPIFGSTFSNVVPVGFVSQFTGTTGITLDYEEIFGTAAMPMVNFYGGAQWNMTGFSIAPTVGFTSGQISGNVIQNGVVVGAATLKVQVASMGVTLNLDSLMKEPYVVPVFEGSINVAQYNEEFLVGTKVLSHSGKSSPFFSYTVGALLQLNWIDSESAFEGLKSSGLNNTFLHLYVGQYASAGGDVSFASKLAMGAGMRLEF